MKQESKIIGINPLWISALLTAAFLFVCRAGGDNVNWGYLGFEVLFPLYAAIAVGEWCRTRTDPMFEVICAQGRSLFGWIVRRFLLLFGIVCAFALAGMAGTVILKGENTMADLLSAFFPTAFFLSGVSVFLSLLGNAPHVPAMAAGVLWLFSVMGSGLLRFAPVRYVYLFARYAGISGPAGTANKRILSSAGVLLWLGTAFLCKRRAIIFKNLL
ncbi:MAG: hypothetical protein NC541_14885 [bacterium]|nr:hypothetical protein [bacterium]